MRKPQGVRWFASKNGYYATINKTRHLLAQGKENYEVAIKRYLALTQDAGVAAIQSGSVSEVSLAYLTRLEAASRSPQTINWAKYRLEDFCRKFGERLAASVKPAEVNAWMLKTHPAWALGTKRNFLGALKAAWSLAGLETFRGKALPRPNTTSRKSVYRHRECVITDEQHDLLLAHASSALARVLTALDQTGHRPGYIMTVEAHEWHETEWVCPPGHGRKIKDRDVVIQLTPTMIELTRQLCTENPTGPLFRTARGKQWNSRLLEQAFRKARQRAGLPKSITTYSYRHRFGSRMAQQPDMTPFMLADLMATSVAMVEKHYFHADRSRQRELLLKAMSGG